jgi:hypothetical protein
VGSFLFLSKRCFAFSQGIWTELPIIVHALDEGWRLPSILTAISQLAQLLPAVVYPIVKLKKPSLFKNQTIIYVKFASQAILLILVSHVWNKVIFFANENRSIGLYVVNFFFSVFGNTRVFC